MRPALPPSNDSKSVFETENHNLNDSGDKINDSTKYGGEEFDPKKIRTQRNFCAKKLLPDTLYQLALCSCMQYGQNVLLVHDTAVALPTISGRSSPSPPSSRSGIIKSSNSYNNLHGRTSSSTNGSFASVSVSEKTNQSDSSDQTSQSRDLTPRDLTPREITPREITPRESTPGDLTPGEVSIGTSPRNQVVINKNPKILNRRSLSPPPSHLRGKSGPDDNTENKEDKEMKGNKMNSRGGSEVDLLAMRRTNGLSKDGYTPSAIPKKSDEAMADLFQKTVYLLDQAKTR